MNLIELQRALTQLRLGGMAAVLETRLTLNRQDFNVNLGSYAAWQRLEISTRAPR
jgi:hypothetical protein